jgi:enoyl-CoA hydratase
MGKINSERAAHWDWLRLQLGKANAIGPALLNLLESELERVHVIEPDGPARPLLITGEGSAFCAGLDLPTLLSFDRQQMVVFLRQFHSVFLRLACLQRPTIAVINGHAVAGGAVLALACDFRIGVRTIGGSGKAPVLGVNEVAIGLPFPHAAAAIVEHGLGGPARAAELMLTGELVGPDAALRCGILHAVVAADDLRASAEQQAERFARAGASAVAAVKAVLRKPLAMVAAEAADDSAFVDAWFSADTQRRLRAVVAKLQA